MVGYYDAREANNAQKALDGRNIFGVKLKLSARASTAALDTANVLDDSIHLLGSLELMHCAKKKSAPVTNFIPFPRSPCQGLDEQPQSVGYESSPPRDRAKFFDKSGKARPRSFSAGHDSSSSLETSPISPVDLNRSPSHPFSPSSTTLNSSPPTSLSAVDSTKYTDLHGRRCSNNLFFDAVGGQNQNLSGRPRSLIADIPVDVRAFDEQQEVDHAPSAYSQPQPQPQQYPTYYYNIPTGSAPYYPPYYNAPGAPLAPNVIPSPPHHFQHPSSSPSNYGYQSDALNANAWPWVPAVTPLTGMVPGPAYYAVSPPPTMPMGGGIYYPPPNSQYQPAHSVGVQGTGSLEPSTYLQADAQPFQPRYPDFVSTPSSFPASSPSGTSYSEGHASNFEATHNGHRGSLHAGGSATSTTLAERNLLNLARIEEGLDTRTTVMVKNIPNKMSDRDLITYIGKVCPRKIDFLYLRMDFQNGEFFGFVRFSIVLTRGRMQRRIRIREFHLRGRFVEVCKNKTWR